MADQEEPTFPFQLPDVLRKLGLPVESALNVYLIGSRLWGTAGSQSDYDLLIVMDQWPPNKPETVHSGLFDAKVLSRQNFVAKLAQAEFEELKCCWLPPSHVLKETLQASTLLKEVGGVNKARLHAGITERTEKDLAKAAKFYEKGKKAEGGKILVHTVRLHLLGAQMATAGMITDYTALSTAELERQGIDLHNVTGPGIRPLLKEVQEGFLVSLQH